MAENKYILNTTPVKPAGTINYAEELNDEQFQVVRDGEGPTLVLAGAGSGKTRTLVYRVAYLLEQGIPADRIMLVTFTNKAAREMMQRVEQLLGRQPKGLWGGTFHSVANRVLRQYGSVLGYDNNFGILDSDDQNKLLKQVRKELSVPKEKYIPKNKVIKSIISFSKNSQKPVKEVIETSYGYLIPEVTPIIERVAEAYEAKKQASNVMDFDDLLANWLKLLQEHPDVGQRFCEKFQYVLVDEFQDTNVVQAKLVQQLAYPQQNLLVVGDDAQSIYSFRAATVENILSFQKVYPSAQLHKLVVNYRSTPEILQLANESIRQNEFQYEKRLKPHHKSFAKPILVPARDGTQQAEVIAQRVLELRDKGASLNDMAVLFRSSFQIIELELELNRRGIPYLVRGGLRFFEQAHIKDVLAYLQILQNPKDEISWRRVLGMYEGVGPATATKVWNMMSARETLSEMLSVLGEMPGRGKSAASFGRIQRLLLKVMEIPQQKIGEIITVLLEQGYQAYVEQNYEDAKDRIEDLSQLAIFAGNYATLHEFLSEASLSEGFKGERAGGQEEVPEELLVLSTIHQAKGLEWDIVFVLGLAEGSFPHYRVMEKPKEMEEERRLFYVAITRPRKLLYLMYPVMTRSYTTGDHINRPSVFLREVNQDLFDTWQVSEVLSGPVISMKKDDTIQYVDEESPDQDIDTGVNSIFDMLKNI